MPLAYCWRTGQIGLGRRLPKGALPIVRHNGRKLRQVVEVLARWAYDNKTMLVPGIPEAGSDVEALAALKRFAEQVKRRLPDGAFMVTP